MPYVCTLDSCRTPNTLFESSKDWVIHMRNQHADGHWSCMDRAHDCALSFNSIPEFKKHMCISHAGGFEVADLDDIAYSCFERRARDPLFADCLFCPRDKSEEIDSPDLVSHVGRHLIDLSQISITNHGQDIEEQSDVLSSRISRAGQNARSRSTSAAESLASSVTTIDFSKTEGLDMQGVDRNHQLSSLLSPEAPETGEANWNYVFNITRAPYDPSRDETIQNFRNYILDSNNEDGEHRVRRRSISLGTPICRVDRHPSPPPDQIIRDLEQAYTGEDLDARSEGQGGTSSGNSKDDAENIQMLISRYRRTGGMSASVGFQFDKGVSSTSGGYVLLDGGLYLLLSDTMVEAHIERLGHPSTTLPRPLVISPSSGDLKELRDIAVRYLSVAESYSKRSQTVSDISSSLLANLENFLQIDSRQDPTIDTKTRVTTILDELYRAEGAYSVGNIVYRSATRLLGSPHPVLHAARPSRMDWALCMVYNHQDVVPNRYRSMKPPEERLKSSHIDMTRHCTETCNIEPYASIYYVGRRGICTGTIGQVPMTVLTPEGTSLEWYIEIDDQLRNEDALGDAGAWVLTCDGNRLMAQVWGYQEGHIVVTPIANLFQDIRDVTGAATVELPRDTRDT